MFNRIKLKQLEYKIEQLTNKCDYMEDLQRVDIKIGKEELKWLGIEAATLGISRRQLMADMLMSNVRTIISIRNGVSRPTPDYISISTDEAVELGLNRESNIGYVNGIEATYTESNKEQYARTS